MDLRKGDGFLAKTLIYIVSVNIGRQVKENIGLIHDLPEKNNWIE